MATRRERVVLDLTDNLSGGLARAAAQAALLRRELDGLNGGTRDASRGNDDLTRSSGRLTNQLGNQDRTMQNGTRQIDRYSGRLKLIGQALAVLGPGAIPIAAVAIPAVTGLATALGFATVAAGTSVLAFQGVGDALKTMSAAHLEPTTANLRAAQLAMEGLSPAAQDLVRKLRSLSDEGKALRDSAAEGLLPGVTQALDELESRIPQLERILHEVGDATGDILASGAESLASSRWDDFFNFLETDARHTLEQLAEAAGNTGHALATMLMAMDPLNDDFMGWLVDATADLDKFAMGLEDSQGFQEFIDYVRQNGPQVAATFAAIGQAVLDIVQAASPLGGVVLQGLESIAKVISAIADSNLGTPIMAGLAAMSLMTRATALWGSTSVVAGRAAAGSTIAAATGYNMVAVNAQRATLSVAEFAAAQRAAAVATSAARAKMGMMAAGIGLMAASQTDYVKSQGLSNTAMFTGLGLMAGPWGAAIGAAAGLTMDLAKSQDDLKSATEGADAALESQSVTQMQASRDAIQAQLDAQDAGARDGTMLNFMGTDWGLAFGQAKNLIGEVGGASDEARGKVAALDSAMQLAFAQDSLQGFTGAGLAQMAAQLDEATISAQELNSAMATLNDTLDRRSSIRDYKAAILDFTDGLKENGKTLDDNTRAGQANLDNLDNLARTALDVADKMKDPGRRATFLDGVLEQFGEFSKLSPKMKREFNAVSDELKFLASQDVKIPVEVDTTAAQGHIASLLRDFNKFPKKLQTDIRANGIPQTMGKIDALVKKYHLTEEQRTALVGLKDLATPKLKDVIKKLDETGNKHPNPKVSVDGGQAIGTLQQVINLFGNINDKSVTITTTHVTKYSGPGNPLIDHAAGGLILGPGTKTSDSIPARLSTGEFVVKAAAVDKYGPSFMHRVNAMQFASGGQVNRAASTAASGWPARLVVHGTLKTPWGPAEIEGIATDVYERNSDADRKFERTRAGR